MRRADATKTGVSTNIDYEKYAQFVVCILARDYYTICLVCVSLMGNKHKTQLHIRNWQLVLILRNKVGHLITTSEQSGQASVLFRLLETDRRVCTIQLNCYALFASK